MVINVIKNFKTLFPKSTTEALHATKNKLIVLKCNQSQIEKLGVYTIKLNRLADVDSL